MTLTSVRPATTEAKRDQEADRKPVGDRALAVAAIEEAEAIFEARPEGIDPQKLVAELQGRGYLLRIAAAALDRLESSWNVDIDPQTGWLNHRSS